MAAFGVSDDVLPLDGVVAWTFGEPRAVPICSLHGAAVQAFGAKVSIAGHMLPLVGRGRHGSSVGGNQGSVSEANWWEWSGRLVVGVDWVVILVGGGAVL